MTDDSEDKVIHHTFRVVHQQEHVMEDDREELALHIVAALTKIWHATPARAEPSTGNDKLFGWGVIETEANDQPLITMVIPEGMPPILYIADVTDADRMNQIRPDWVAKLDQSIGWAMRCEIPMIGDGFQIALIYTDKPDEETAETDTDEPPR